RSAPRSSTAKITTFPTRCRAMNDAPWVVASTIGRIRRSRAERPVPACLVVGCAPRRLTLAAARRARSGRRPGAREVDREVDRSEQWVRQPARGLQVLRAVRAVRAPRAREPAPRGWRRAEACSPAVSRQARARASAGWAEGPEPRRGRPETAVAEVSDPAVWCSAGAATHLP